MVWEEVKLGQSSLTVDDATTAATELVVLRQLGMTAATARVLGLRQLIDLHTGEENRPLRLLFGGSGHL